MINKMESKKIVKVGDQYHEFLEIVPIAVDGQLHYFGFKLDGFVAPYTDYKNKPISLRELAEHDRAQAEAWRKANAEKRDQIEGKFKLGPIVAPMVATGVTRSTIFMELSRDQYEEATNASSKADLIDRLDAAEEEAKALKQKDWATDKALKEAQARIAELETELTKDSKNSKK